jgi:hypothetical protein
MECAHRIFAMNFYPSLKTTHNTQLSPGELVRAPYGANFLYAIGVRKPLPAGDARSGLVYLESDGQFPAPFYMETDRENPLVLSLGVNFEIIVPNDPAKVDLNGNRYWRSPGAIVIRDNFIFLIAHSPNPANPRQREFIDLQTWELVDPPQPLGIILIGEWKLRLSGYPEEHELSKPLVGFSL